MFFFNLIFFILDLRVRRLKSLVCKVGTVGMVGLGPLGWLVWSVGNTCTCGKVFADYKPGWSPIREQVVAAIVYSQSRCMINFNHCPVPIHKCMFSCKKNFKLSEEYFLKCSSFTFINFK